MYRAKSHFRAIYYRGTIRESPGADGLANRNISIAQSYDICIQVNPIPSVYSSTNDRINLL